MKVASFIRSETYKKGMAYSVLFNIVSKSILFLLTICIALYFGSDVRTDIYFFIYGTMILFSGLLNHIDTAVLIPESMRLREQEGAASSMAFLNFFFRAYCMIGIVFTVLFLLFATGIFSLISRFDEAAIISYRNYFLLGSGYFIFQLLTNYMNTILSSLKYFTIPMIVSAVNSCLVIIGIVLLHERYGVLAVLISGIVAYAINFIFLLYVMKKLAGWNFSLQSAPFKKRIWKNIFFAELGQLATVAGNYFPLYLLSGFGNGVISSMSYGKNIADIPNTLVTAQVANVSGIQLNEQAARQDHPAMNESFIKTSRFLVFLLAPLSCFLFLFAAPVTELFYKRGNFNVADVSEAARFLQILSLAIFAIGINAMVSRVFIALQVIRQAFYYQLLVNGLLIAAIWLFTKQYGAYGYPYAVIAMHALNLILMYFICRKLAGFINYSTLLLYTGLLVLVNAGIGAIIYFLATYLQVDILLKLTLSLIAYGTILLLVNRVFHLNTTLIGILKPPTRVA